MALIEIRDVHQSFGPDAVLRGVDLDIRRHEVITLIGVSGSGKSVLLKTLIGLLPIDAGEIRLDGKPISGLSERDLVPVRRRVGMLFQANALFDSLTVAANVAFPLREQTTMSEGEIDERVAECLRLVDLPGIEALWPSELSGGMKKRVALARAIAVRPEIVLYDEPSEGLDPINVTRVNRLLLGLRDELGITTVVVTHNMECAFAISDRIALLDEGRIALALTPDEMRSAEHPVAQEFVASLLEEI